MTYFTNNLETKCTKRHKLLLNSKFVTLVGVSFIVRPDSPVSSCFNEMNAKPVCYTLYIAEPKNTGKGFPTIFKRINVPYLKSIRRRDLK